MKNRRRKNRKTGIEKSSIIAAIFLALLIICIVSQKKASFTEEVMTVNQKEKEIAEHSMTEIPLSNLQESQMPGDEGEWGKDQEIQKEKAQHLTDEASSEDMDSLVGNDTDANKNLLEKEDILKNLSIEEKVAQMFIVTPDALTQVSGTTWVGDTTTSKFREIPISGFVMLQNNIVDRQQVKDFTQDLKSLSKDTIGVVPFLCVDEEGGTVTRIASNVNLGISNVGRMIDIGATKDTDQAYQVGKQLGGYLSELGFNVNFAPDSDVLVNENNQVIGSRSFGSDENLVSEMVAKAVEGIRSQKVCATLKHFPGHGATAEDSHNGFAYSPRTLQEIEKCELRPFEVGIEAGAEFVMIGHITFPNILGGEMPATLSSYFIKDVLRNQLGFEGIVITDAMNMGAISNNYTPEEAAIKAIEAGNDIILMPLNFERAYQAVIDAVDSGRLTIRQIDESVGRILDLKLKIENVN